MIEPNIIEKSIKILRKYPLCSRCLGRQFHLLEEDLDSELIGTSIKLYIHLEAMNFLSKKKRKIGIALLNILSRSGYEPSKKVLTKMNIKLPKEEPCYICNNKLFSNFDSIVEEVRKKSIGVEFSSFQVASIIPSDIIKRDDSIKIEFGISTGESIKTEFNRLLTNIIKDKLKKRSSQHRPDVTITVDFMSSKIEIKPNPIYIYGRYKKLVSGISQTRKVGKDPLTSIEGALATIFVPAFDAKDVKFHGAGREDVDALMLGNGRPFVLEIVEPRRRSADLLTLEEKFNSSFKNRIEINSLRFCERKTIVKLKMLGEKVNKVYRLRVLPERMPSQEEILEVERKVKDLVILQRTPTRVLWRRSDKVRKKIIKWIKITPLDEKTLEVMLEVQGGTYVKEFIDGDNGRTKPSLAELLNIPLRWESLEVLEIKGE